MRPGDASPPHARTATLLGTQLLFNVGFYAVVPFIAVVLADDFALAGAAVGLVLGVRTFAQQGMFLVGGALADRFGPRPVILLGCGVRTAGFLALAASLWSVEPRLWLFIAGTMLTGLGGALFSPALNVLVAAAEGRRDRTGTTRATLFAWLSVTGELGAVVGPLVGAALLGWGFAAVAASGAAFFAAIGMFLFLALPARPRPARTARRVPGRGLPAALRDRRFVAFASVHAVDLLAYNQLYLSLPLELRRLDTAPQLVGLVFAWASVLTLALQLPVARWCARVGTATALRCGYATGAAAFALLAVSALVDPPGAVRIACAFGAVTLIVLGHLTAHPTALATVGRFAGSRPTGSFFGLLASLGGVAVLVGNLVTGWALGAGDEGAAAALPWVLLALPLTASALLIRRVLDDERPGGRTAGPLEDAAGSDGD